MSQLTRYLYDKNAVRLSLLNAILKKDNNRSLFWFFELYYSKLYDESVSLIYRIFCLFYLTTNFNFTKILNTNISLWRQTNDIKPLADIIYNLTLLNKDHRSTQPFIILQTINKNNNKIILYRGRKPKWCANFPTKYLQFLQSINKRHYQNIYYYSKYLIDSELFQIIVQYFDIVENKTVGEIDSLLEILDTTDAFSAIILTLCIANHSSSDSTDTLQLYSCDEELIDAIYENNCLNITPVRDTIIHKRIFKVDESIGAFNNQCFTYPEIIDVLINWEKNALNTPLWNERFQKYNCRVAKGDAGDDDSEEQFYELYGFEPDEMPKEVELSGFCYTDYSARDWLKTYIYNVDGNSDGNGIGILNENMDLTTIKLQF